MKLTFLWQRWSFGHWSICDKSEVLVFEVSVTKSKFCSLNYLWQNQRFIHWSICDKIEVSSNGFQIKNRNISILIKIPNHLKWLSWSNPNYFEVSNAHQYSFSLPRFQFFFPQLIDKHLKKVSKTHKNQPQNVILSNKVSCNWIFFFYFLCFAKHAINKNFNQKTPSFSYNLFSDSIEEKRLSDDPENARHEFAFENPAFKGSIDFFYHLRKEVKVFSCEKLSYLIETLISCFVWFSTEDEKKSTLLGNNWMHPKLNNAQAKPKPFDDSFSDVSNAAGAVCALNWQ